MHNLAPNKIIAQIYDKISDVADSTHHDSSAIRVFIKSMTVTQLNLDGLKITIRSLATLSCDSPQSAWFLGR